MNLTVSERVNRCSKCGNRIDRDSNAALNILNFDCPNVTAENFDLGFRGVDNTINGGLLRLGGGNYRSQNSMRNPRDVEYVYFAPLLRYQFSVYS